MKKKNLNDHGRETAERDASWERKHKEIQEQTEDRIVSELEERFESEREELRNHHGRETAERNALWEVNTRNYTIDTRLSIKNWRYVMKA